MKEESKEGGEEDEVHGNVITESVFENEEQRASIFFVKTIEFQFGKKRFWLQK